MVRAGPTARLVFRLIGWPVLLDLALTVGWELAKAAGTRCKPSGLAITDTREALNSFVSLVTTVLVAVAVGAVTAADRVIQKRKLFPRQIRTLPSGSDLEYRLERVATDFDASARWLGKTIRETGGTLSASLRDLEFEQWLATELVQSNSVHIDRARAVRDNARYLQDLIALPQHAVPAEHHRVDLVYALRTIEDAAHSAIIHVDGAAVLERSWRLAVVSPEIATAIVICALLPQALFPIHWWIWMPELACPIHGINMPQPVVLAFYIFCIVAVGKCAHTLRKVFFQAVNL